jgi:hypothetical protein
MVAGSPGLVEIHHRPLASRFSKSIIPTLASAGRLAGYALHRTDTLILNEGAINRPELDSLCAGVILQERLEFDQGSCGWIHGRDRGCRTHDLVGDDKVLIDA